MSNVWSTRYERWDSKVVGANCYLACSNLVEHVAVHAYCIRSACEYIHLLPLHHEGRHVVRYDCDVESHVVADRSSEPCALEVRTSLRTEEPYPLAPFAAFFEHHSKYRFCKALRHDRSVVWEHIDKVFGTPSNLCIAHVVGLHDEIPYRNVNALSLCKGLLRGWQTGLGDYLHAVHRSWAGVGYGV